MVLDENEDLCQTPCNRSTKTKTPTKAVVNNSRSALSPTKVNGSARVSIYPQSKMLNLHWRREDAKVSRQSQPNCPLPKPLAIVTLFPKKSQSLHDIA